MNSPGLRTWVGIVVVILAFGLLTCEEGSLLTDLDELEDAGGADGGGDDGTGDDPEPVNTLPLVGGSLSVELSYLDGNPPSYGATLTWNAASDQETAATDLLYQAYHSIEGAIGTVDDAVANGTAIFSTPLTQATTAYCDELATEKVHHFVVVVTDGDGGAACYLPVSATAGTGPRLVVVRAPAGDAATVGEGTVVDLGDVPYWTTGSWEFRIENTGDEPLTITEVGRTPDTAWTTVDDQLTERFWIDPEIDVPVAIEPESWQDIIIRIHREDSSFEHVPVAGDIALSTDAANVVGDFLFTVRATLLSN